MKVQLTEEQILEQAKKWVNHNKLYTDKRIDGRDINNYESITLDEFLSFTNEYKDKENIVISFDIRCGGEYYSDEMSIIFSERKWETDEEQQKRIDAEIKRSIKNFKEANKPKKSYKEKLEEEKKKKEANEKRAYARLKKKYGE